MKEKNDETLYYTILENAYFDAYAASLRRLFAVYEAGSAESQRYRTGSTRMG